MVHPIILALADAGHDHAILDGKIHAIHPRHGHPVPVHTARKLAAFLHKHGGRVEGTKVHGEHSPSRLDKRSRGGKVPEHHLFGGPVSPQERAAIAIKRRAMPAQAFGQRPFKHGGKARHHAG